jgi:hypothetical protein
MRLTSYDEAWQSVQGALLNLYVEWRNANIGYVQGGFEITELRMRANSLGFREIQGLTLFCTEISNNPALQPFDQPAASYC